MKCYQETTRFSTCLTLLCVGIYCVQAFQIASETRSSGFSHGIISNKLTSSLLLVLPIDETREGEEGYSFGDNQSRRRVLRNTALATLSYASIFSRSESANASVGQLPEFSDTNAVLQGITVDIADKSQLDEMIEFLNSGFECKLLRERKIGSVTDVWLGYGPEQMSVPESFELPVSSFAKYGGHASIHLRYDSQSTDLFYRRGQGAPGNNLAYIQLGVPEYRISQMVTNGGNIIDAYGIVNVVSPSGIPFRGIIGISPDPIMFVALNCQSVKKSRVFYEQLGFVEQEYPFCRPNKGKGQIEPPQPKNSVYLAPSAASMGVLLLPSPKRNVKINPVLRSLNVIYQPSVDAIVDPSTDFLKVLDPSSVTVSFEPFELFEKVEASTRLIMSEEPKVGNEVNN